jgi:predicted dinucleotide-binding enzyme
MNISILGDGNVGSALARGLEKAGHDVRTCGHDPDRERQLAEAGDVIILAVRPSPAASTAKRWWTSPTRSRPK